MFLLRQSKGAIHTFDNPYARHDQDFSQFVKVVQRNEKEFLVRNKEIRTLGTKSASHHADAEFTFDRIVGNHAIVITKLQYTLILQANNQIIFFYFGME